jgi:hypothetical protein
LLFDSRLAFTTKSGCEIANDYPDYASLEYEPKWRGQYAIQTEDMRHAVLYVTVCEERQHEIQPRAEFGRGEKIRTSDFIVPNDALYQAELHPEPAAIIPIYKSIGQTKLPDLGGYDAGEFHRNSARCS